MAEQQQTEGAKIARALRDTLISPNERDTNLEPANVIDGLYAIARSLAYVADELKSLRVLRERELLERELKGRRE